MFLEPGAFLDLGAFLWLSVLLQAGMFLVSGTVRMDPAEDHKIILPKKKHGGQWLYEP